MSDGIRIVTAAVQHKGKTYTGTRHGLIMQSIWEAAEKAGLQAPKIPFEAQGFLTSDGRFVNRFQAGGIAYRAGQTKTRHEHLLSEHVW